MLLNIAAYHLVEIVDPQAFAVQLRVAAEAGELRGTVLVAGEGINLFLAGQASAIHAFLGQLRNDGMDNVMQLDGGILGYFEQVGGAGYDGRCFVFDERVALDLQLQPLVDGAA